MSVFQIWGFRDGFGTVSGAMFQKDQMMGDGVTRMEDWERENAKKEGTEMVLLHEMDLTEFFVARRKMWGMPDPSPLPESLQREIAALAYDAFWTGHWKGFTNGREVTMKVAREELLREDE